MQNLGLNTLRKIFVFAAMAIVAGCAPSKYSGGTGEPNNPYIIATAEDLLAFAADLNDYSAYVLITADIDLAPNLPGRKVFTCAVISGRGFCGVLDGAGHKIRNLTIDTGGGGKNFLGLIGFLKGGEIKNLNVENISIRAGASSDYLGGLAGFNNKGKITNCSTTGDISGGDSCDSVGGLVGDNFYGIIGNCYSRCYVSGGVSSSNIGGLAGRNIGTISDCFARGTVNAATFSMWIGGLAGSNNGHISNCYSTGAVTAGENSYNLGGLVGDNLNGTITNCFSATTPRIIAFLFRRQAAF
jgi:hypothetical protein